MLDATPLPPAPPLPVTPGPGVNAVEPADPAHQPPGAELVAASFDPPP